MNYKPSVFVKRTEVSASTAQDSSQAEKAGQEPNKHCPIHNKPHPFFKCRAFRNKLLDERKSFLKDNSICYWCCASTKHMAKDCKVSVRCRECDSDRHVSALHPGPAPLQHEEAKADPEQQEEQPDVTSKCTEIFGTSPQRRSCSKICLVNVYPINHPTKAQCLYAVLDDHSNCSLAKTQLFDLFGIKGSPSPYTL